MKPAVGAGCLAIFARPLSICPVTSGPVVVVVVRRIVGFRHEDDALFQVGRTLHFRARIVRSWQNR